MHVDEKTLLRLLADEATQRKAFEMLVCQLLLSDKRKKSV